MYEYNGDNQLTEVRTMMIVWTVAGILMVIGNVLAPATFIRLQEFRF